MNNMRHTRHAAMRHLGVATIPVASKEARATMQPVEGDKIQHCNNKVGKIG